jgi:hypothetical protein
MLVPAITFCHVGQEGDILSRPAPCKKKSTALNARGNKKGKRFSCNHSPIYCCATTPGLTFTQFDALTSPAFKAYMVAHPNLFDQILLATQALCVAFLSPTAKGNHCSSTDRYPVTWESCASTSISPHRSDFVGPLEVPPIGIKLQGNAKGLTIQGIGHVVDNTGMLRTLKILAYHVAGTTARLLSANSLLQTYPGETIHQMGDHLILSGDKQNNLRGIEILTEPQSNLPVGYAYEAPSFTKTGCVLCFRCCPHTNNLRTKYESQRRREGTPSLAPSPWTSFVQKDSVLATVRRSCFLRAILTPSDVRGKAAVLSNVCCLPIWQTALVVITWKNNQNSS